MSEVVLENVVKNFDEVVAVDNVSMKIKKQEFLTLLGPSGCGKTTTLRLIAGLEEATSGNIYIGDKVVNAIPPKNRNIAMVFQSYALYPHMSVFDNIGFPLRIAKTAKDTIAVRVKEVASVLGIEELLDRKPKELSGGQRQRVALGRAIVRSPTVFLMDEPLSNLDAKLRTQMRVELKRLQKDLAITTIYVTHDQIEALTMSDRVALMNKGKVVQIGTSEEVYDKPDDIWVAGFLGSPSANFIECSLDEKDGEIHMVHSDFRLRLPNGIAKVVQEKVKRDSVVLAFRPEDASLSSKREPNTIEARIYALEPIGDALIVDLMVGNDLVKVKAKAGLSVEVGSKAFLRVDMDRLHLFDTETEKRIIL